MGHPKKPRKQYDTPSHPWNADRIKEENRLASKYGLKNKKEIWKADSKVKRYRRDARILLGMDPEEAKVESEQLLNHLVRTGILSPNAKLEEVLDLNVEDVLRRRLENRTTNPDIKEITLRLNRFDYEESKIWMYDYVLKNNDLEKTVDIIMDIIKHEPMNKETEF
jgi:ABC-type Fe3+/spermidine/putrescine transport system ATPase subunit